MRYTVIGIFFISLFGCTQDIQESTSEIWKEFVNSVENPGTDSRLIDFSYAGYDFGESDLPENNQSNYFIVTDFGALADDDISDFEAIQKAIDAAEKAGGGCVFFPPGRFLLNEEKDCQQSLLVRSSNIIIKGSGDKAGGTELFMKEHLVPDDPSRMWTTPPMIHLIGDKKESAINSKLKSNVSRGASTLEFESAPNLEAGDIILLNAQGTFLNEQMLEGRKTREIWEDINVLGAEVVELHQVMEVDGAVVRLRAPVLIDIDRDEAWKIVKYNMISNCGFENIHFIGNFHDEYVHHKDARHDSGWTGLRMTRCFNSWVRNCSFTNVSSGASLKMSLASVILRCKTEGNMGHEGFTTSTSTRCMIAYCEDNAPEFHGPCSSHAAVGCVIFRFKGITTGYSHDQQGFQVKC
ncbi:glycosyl hydrolase family 28-related protein [Bacteroidota bacterium]